MQATKLILTCGPGIYESPYGDVLVLDWERKRIIDKFRFKHNVYESSHKGLAGASWRGDELLVAAECELLELAVAPLRLKRTRSFPFLNDVHHLSACNGRIWVCNTGLDCIEVLDEQWRVVETHDLLGAPLRRLRYSYTAAYDTVRRGYHTLRGWRRPYAHLSRRPLFRSTKKLLRTNAYRRKERELRFTLFRPHILHPNHVLPLDGDVWVTLCTTGEIVSLKTDKILTNGLGRAHDGIVAGNEHYVTDPKSNRLIVHEFDPTGPFLGKKKKEKIITASLGDGFLRGVAAVEDRVFVGLTVRRGPSGYCPRGRLVALDRTTLEPVDEWTLPEEYGTLIFSVLNGTHAYT